MADNTFGTGQPGENAFPDPETMSYERARDELAETVRILELGQMSLDESLKYWERGEALAKRCEVLLQGAAQRVESVIQERVGAEQTGNAGRSDAAGGN